MALPALLIRNADCQACPYALNRNLHWSRFSGEQSVPEGLGSAVLSLSGPGEG